MKKLETTLLLLIRDERILLALKKKGFGVGKYNGVGGKLEPGETPEMAMIRETQEEIGVVPTKFEKIGINEFFEYVKGENTNLILHLYVGSEWEGEPFESEEMKPEWFDFDKIPYDNMFADDRYWLPYVIQGRKFDATFSFDENWNLLGHEIRFTDKLD